MSLNSLLRLSGVDFEACKTVFIDSVLIIDLLLDSANFLPEAVDICVNILNGNECFPFSFNTLLYNHDLVYKSTSNFGTFKLFLFSPT